MSVIVTGGLGYIGSFVVRELLKSTTSKVIVIDNECTDAATPSAVNEWREKFMATPTRRGVEALYKGDCGDLTFLNEVFTRHSPVSAVVHMAAYIMVEESVKDPLKYYDNNLSSLMTLVKAMRRHQCRRIIFCSSCTAQATSTHAYGDTKKWGEQILERSCKAYGLGCVVLRFFNACGASEDSSIGEIHEPETHVIPLFLRKSLAIKKAAEKGETLPTDECSVSIFGTDYDTPDGTCIRDYVHVEDLAIGHVLSLQKLWALKDEDLDSGFFEDVNLGSGTGTSVKELVRVVEEVTGYQLPVKLCGRRPGDFVKLVADSSNAERALGWKTQRDTKKSVLDAWNFLVKYDQEHH